MTPEELNIEFAAMDDSVTIIDHKILDGPGLGETQADVNEMIDMNVRHLQHMLQQSYIQTAGRPLATYQTAVTNGQNYINTHGGL